MAREVSTQRKTINTVVAWAIGLLIFFPILWTVLTSFKTEATAIADPPVFFFFDWTLENYSVVQERSDYMRYLWNSVIIAGGSTLLGILIAVPAAWSMAFVPGRRTKDILLWMLSTKMLPAVGVLYPIYLLFIQLGLLDSRIGLVIVLMLINLPIIVWMLYTYFQGNSEGHPRSRTHGRRVAQVRDPLRADTDGASRNRVHNPPEHHPRLERGVLDPQSDCRRCSPAHRLHRQLFEPGRPVLREAVRRVDHGDRTDFDHGLVQPETAGPRHDLRRREMIVRRGEMIRQPQQFMKSSYDMEKRHG